LEDSCGDCGVKCGAHDIAFPKYCCSVAGKNTCTALGSTTHCDGCNSPCSGNTNTCCLLSPVTAGSDTFYGCRDTTRDINYCGPNCLDCTDPANGGANFLCCKGKCVFVDDTDLNCGCDDVRACSVGTGSVCCQPTVPPPALLALASQFTCTALQTMSNCGFCNNACGGPGTPACCPDDVMDPLSSGCTNLLTDMNNCGKCGRVCDALTEQCCSGECRSLYEMDNCGLCGRQCNAASQLCCGPGLPNCQNYLTSNTACGCPATPQNCQSLMAPPENHDGAYTCCKGKCFPTWENCMD